MIKCIIVEDEVLAQNVIQSHLQKIKNFELVATCNNALEAKEILEKHTVDLIFLDIQLPGMTGLNFLRNLDKMPLVVFTTAYSEYALESYEFNVADYLLKPISFERFSKSVNKIIERYSTSDKVSDPTKNYIFIKSNGKFFRVDFSDIVYVEAMKDYVKIISTTSKLITLQTMNEMEKILPANQFTRVHKSYIVALSQIKIINGNTIETANAVIPIGINYRDKIMQLVYKK